MEENRTRFRFSRFTKGLVITTTTIYALVLLVAVFETVLGILYLNGSLQADSKLAGLLFTGVSSDGYSGFILAIVILVLIYCAMGIVMTVSSYMRARPVYLTIEGDTVSGYDLPEPSKWKRGRNFSIAASEIVSTGISEVKLYGRTHTDALVINTAGARFTIPALDDVKEARRAVERLR